MNKFLLTGVLLLVLQVGYGQLDNTFTQNNLLPFMFNAGASGMQQGTDFKLVAKRPFGANETAVKDYFFGINHGIILPNQNRIEALINKSTVDNSRPVKLGISGFVRQRDFSSLTNVTGNLSFSVQVPITRRHYLSFGLSTSYGQIRVRTQSLIIRDLQDSYYTSLLKSGGSVSNFDLGGGLVFYSNKLLIGYSVNGLAGTRFESNLASNDRPPMSQYLMVGYKFDINGSWKFDPSILVRHQVGTPIFYNVQAKFSYNETVWAGLAYISDKTISLLAGYEVSKKFQIGYSYDIGMGSQNNVLSNTNELILGFKPFIKEKKSETPEE